MENLEILREIKEIKVMRLQKDFDPIVQSIKILCELFKDIF